MGILHAEEYGATGQLPAINQADYLEDVAGGDAQLYIRRGQPWFWFCSLSDNGDGMTKVQRKVAKDKI